MTKRVGPRYAILPADAVTDPALSGPDLKVLALLGRHIDKKGWCTRAQKRMADELSIARGTLQRSLGRLVDAGYVEVEQVQRRDGGQAANRYRVILDDQARADQLDLFSFVTDAVRDEGEGTPCLTDEAPLPHLERAPPASPRRGTHKERPLYRTSPSEEAALPSARVPANDEPMLAPLPDAVPARKANPARPTLDDFAAGAVRMRRPSLEAQGADAVPPDAPGDAAERDRIRFADLRGRLQAATAGRVDVTAFLVLAEPFGWIAAGCDLEADILPTVEGLCARQRGGVIRSWSYFAAAVAEARDRRQAAINRPPKPAAGTIVPFEPNGASHDKPAHGTAGRRPGRFAAIAELRRRQLAGDDPGGA
ncbi:helix-turn-helix domain-containing protein [Aureimonas phyllosphaerae]|uniref:helix-turn-helix domain-containing protein n=1 Tax=Aureimonas phyllosphaerae TaxID=1166078 RepID=UPI003A5C38C9